MKDAPYCCCWVIEVTVRACSTWQPEEMAIVLELRCQAYLLPLVISAYARPSPVVRVLILHWPTIVKLESLVVAALDPWIAEKWSRWSVAAVSLADNVGLPPMHYPRPVRRLVSARNCWLNPSSSVSVATQPQSFRLDGTRYLRSGYLQSRRIQFPPCRHDRRIGQLAADCRLK